MVMMFGPCPCVSIRGLQADHETLPDCFRAGWSGGGRGGGAHGASGGAGGGAAGGAGLFSPSQLPLGTQLGGGTQFHGTQQAAGALAALAADDDADDNPSLLDALASSGPRTLSGLPADMFETFWQGRLVPQGRAAPLPFMETAALRNRSAAARDELPDAALGRVRGCLFFGPSWKVRGEKPSQPHSLSPVLSPAGAADSPHMCLATSLGAVPDSSTSIPRPSAKVTRNKLSFRDDLPKLLLESEPLERNLDKKFREWLTRCHAELDRSITYERALPAAEQAAARRTHGEASTVFERCVGALPSDRSAAVRRGDLLWLRVGKGANAQIAARCAGFLVPQAVKTDGPYPGGRVLAVRLPELIHGSQPAPHAVGRILAACSEQQAAEAAEKELSRAPARVKVEEPLSFTGGQVVLTAGAPVPEITAKVLTATGQPVTRTVLGGNKVALTLVQTLVYLGPEPKEVEGGEGGAAAATAGDGEPAAADDGVAPMEEDGAAAAENGGGGGGKGGKRGAGGAKRKTPAKDAELRDVSNLPEEAGEAEAEGAAAGGKPRKKAKSGAATAAAEQQQQQAEAEEAAAAAAAAKGKGKGKGKKAAALLAAAEQAADPRQVITQARQPPAAQTLPPHEPQTLTHRASCSHLDDTTHPPHTNHPRFPQVRNSTPGGQSYAFRRFDTGSDCATPALGRAGRYALEFHVAEAPFVPVLSISIAVKPGAPASFALEGSFGSASATAAAAQAAHAAGDSASQEARRGVGASSEDVGGMVTTAAATAPAGRLGSPLGDLAMRFFDAHGNAIERLGKPRPVVNMNVRPVAGNCDVEAVARGSAKGGSMMRLFGFRIEGAIEGDGAEGAAAAAEAKPLGLFSSPQPAARGCATLRPPTRTASLWDCRYHMSCTHRSSILCPPARLCVLIHADPPLPLRRRKGAAAAAGSLPVAQVLVTVGCDNMDVAVTFVQPLCPGVPARLVALPPSAAAAERPRRGGGHHAAAAADGSDGAVTVGPGGALSLVAGTSGLLPAVHVSCFDRWGHPTWPSGPAGPIRSAAVASGEPEWTVVATCAAAEPKEAVLPIDPATGIASTEGIFRAPPEPTAEGSPVEMTFRVVPGAAASEADAEAISAVPHATAALTVEPSRDPTFLLLLRDGAALPRSSLPPETENAPPKSLVLLDGLLAGSVLSGLTVLLTDSACQPVPRPVRGRLTVGWASGSKRLALGGGAAAAGGDGGVADGVAVTLPNLAVPREAGREHELAVSFLVESGGALLETIVRIVPAAGPPHAWTLSVVDRASEQEGAASSSQASQGGSGIRAGVPFTVVVEAHDEHGSRARRPSASGGPNPRLEVAGARPLQLRMLDAGQWADAPGGGETWTARAVVEGGAGEATLTVKDATPAAPAADPSAAPFDAALAQPQGNPLKQDSVRFELLPGPPAALAFVGGARINTSTRAVLRDLTVVAVDQWGSQTALPTGGGGVDVKLESVAVGLPAEPDPFDSGKESMEGDDADALMALPRNPAAAGADGDGEDGAAGGGSAEPAAVAPVSGAAKKRLGDDGACFGAVRFCAPRPGSFILRATATARKGYAGPPLTDAQATVHAKASNRVTAVRLAPSGSLPAAAATDGGGAAANGPCLSLRVGAGECCAVDVFLGTEDTLPPPSRDAVEGLSVWLSAPGGASKARDGFSDASHLPLLVAAVLRVNCSPADFVPVSPATPPSLSGPAGQGWQGLRRPLPLPLAAAHLRGQLRPVRRVRRVARGAGGRPERRGGGGGGAAGGRGGGRGAASRAAALPAAPGVPRRVLARRGSGGQAAAAGRFRGNSGGRPREQLQRHRGGRRRLRRRADGRAGVGAVAVRGRHSRRVRGPPGGRGAAVAVRLLF